VLTVGSYDTWAADHEAVVTRVLALLDDVRTHGTVDLATLSVALRDLRTLA
jgi:NAD-specific glutamate dehydrogenase